MLSAHLPKSYGRVGVCLAEALPMLSLDVVGLIGDFALEPRLIRSIDCEFTSRQYVSMCADEACARIVLCEPGRIQVLDGSTGRYLYDLPWPAAFAGYRQSLPIAVAPNLHVYVFGDEGTIDVFDCSGRDTVVQLSKRIKGFSQASYFSYVRMAFYDGCLFLANFAESSYTRVIQVVDAGDKGLLSHTPLNDIICDAVAIHNGALFVFDFSCCHVHEFKLGSGFKSGEKLSWSRYAQLDKACSVYRTIAFDFRGRLILPSLFDFGGGDDDGEGFYADVVADQHGHMFVLDSHRLRINVFIF